MTTEKAEPVTLLPCPFCGGIPMLTAYHGNYNKASWCVHCRECDLSLDGDATPEEAVKRWNTRATPPRCDAQREALRKARQYVADAGSDEDSEICAMGGR